MKSKVWSIGLSGSATLHPHRPIPQRTTRIVIVGITGDGYVPVVERYVGSTGRSVVGLPSLVAGTPLCDLEQTRGRLAAGLSAEFGYEADELIPMGPRSVGGPSGPVFLLAPLLEVADWRARVGFVPGVYEVALGAVPEWLRQRRLAGARESPELRKGLLLADEAFPRWAQSRLGEALEELGNRPARSIS